MKKRIFIRILLDLIKILWWLASFNCPSSFIKAGMETYSYEIYEKYISGCQRMPNLEKNIFSLLC
jgi:hypothetical protein